MGLSPDYEQTLWERWNRCTCEADRRRVQREIMVAYMPLARIVAKSRERRSTTWIKVELDELLSVAMVGMAAAIQRFRPGCGVQFATYARRRMHGEISDWMRSLVNPPRTFQGFDVNLPAPDWSEADSPDDDAEEDCIGPQRIDPHARPGHAMEQSEWIERLMGQLGAGDRLLVTLQVVDGISVADICRTLGLSRRAVWRRLGISLRVLRVASDDRTETEWTPGTEGDGTAQGRVIPTESKTFGETLSEGSANHVAEST